MKILIVNADDFGLCAGVNAAIIDAFRAGSLSSTTLMVNAEASVEAAQLATRHPGLGVGLHFNLTLGRPCADPLHVPSLLVGDGQFLTRSALARRLLLGRVRSEEIRLELHAQLAMFTRLGLVPTHLDSHQHVHGFPPVFNHLAQECVARSLPLRQPWVSSVTGSRSPLGRTLRSAVLTMMNVHNHRRWIKRLRSNAAFTSVFDFGRVPVDLSVEHYRALLGGTVSSPCELMVHLARDPRDVDRLTRIGDVAHAEWSILKSDAFARLIAELGWQLRTYRDAFESREP